MNRSFLTTLSASLLLGLLVAAPATAADHLDSPSVQDNGQLDINDIYVFRSPTNQDMAVFIVTVNPAAGVMSPTTFSSRGQYDLEIDTNGDALPDTGYTFLFSRVRRGRQGITVINGENEVVARGNVGTPTPVAGGGQVVAGLYEDPFYFDLNGFDQDPSQIMFDNGDFFAGLNVTAIVLEVPISSFPSPNIGVTMVTSIRGRQFDRMGRPGITTVLIPSGTKDAYNQGRPTTDRANFSDEVSDQITTFSDAANAAALTPVLLPDVLTVDLTSFDGYAALNGRNPADDVIDISLNLLTDGALTNDNVPMNDAVLPITFPYLASPNPIDSDD